MVSYPHRLQPRGKLLSASQSIAVIYHDIFDYPLKERELVLWEAGRKMRMTKGRPQIENCDGYCFIRGRKNLVNERLEKEAESRRKMDILSKAKTVLEENKNILMVGITGSLAMASAKKGSDIDLMVVTKHGTLWRTRLLTLWRLHVNKVNVRRAGSAVEKDKICMNIWMDENDLVLGSDTHNAYTAHELAQIVPVIDRDLVHKRLLAQNRWISEYWPNAVDPGFETEKSSSVGLSLLNRITEKIAYLMQTTYMRSKKTREIVTPTRAFFHPINWSLVVEKKLQERGVVSEQSKTS